MPKNLPAMSSRDEYDAIIVGGGFYGCLLAIHLRKSGAARVLLMERESSILQRASYANQARVHNGYHYPRSFLTALRSRVNFPRFVADYKECIDDNFDQYYAISKVFSNITAGQFHTFCTRIGAPVEPALPEIRDLFNQDLIEQVFRVREAAFDAGKLRQRVIRDLEEYDVAVSFESEALRVVPATESRIEVISLRGGAEARTIAGRVFNCTYSRINKLLVDSGLAAIPLKHELTEMALVEVPPVLRKTGITVMCGPFFSLMPFPAQGLHCLSHVRYTPHHEWFDTVGETYRDPYAYCSRAVKVSSFPQMIQDAQRYLPLIKQCRYQGSLWEVKTVLPKSEVDDSRPILLRPGHGLANLTSIMGSKIDNVYDMMDMISISPRPITNA